MSTLKPQVFKGSNQTSVDKITRQVVTLMFYCNKVHNLMINVATLNEYNFTALF